MRAIYQLVKLNRAVSSRRAKIAAVLLADLLHLRHLFVRFDPILACNLRCAMCHFSDPRFRKANKGMLNMDAIRRIGDQLFPRTLQFVLGCGAEPTLHRDFLDIVALAKSHRIPFVSLVTNAQKLDTATLHRLAELRLSEIVISLHGVHQSTYESLMVNASYSKLHEVLGILRTVKVDRPRMAPSARLNYTVNPDNLAELESFFEVFGSYPIDTLQVRPIVDLGDTAYKNKNISAYGSRYERVIAKLRKECEDRGTALLAAHTLSSAATKAGAVLPYVLRYVSPQVVWRPDFDWQSETYAGYCRRIGWRKHLARRVLAPGKAAEGMENYLTYDVDL